MTSDAQRHLKDAKKALKTNFLLLKFTPDLEVAAMEFNQAATCFQNAGQHQDAFEAFKDSARTKEKMADPFGGGRSWEAAANVCELHTKDWKACVECLDNASICYRSADKLETSVRVLQKIARICEDHLNDIQQAVKVYDQCFDLYGCDEHTHAALDLSKLFVDFLLRHEMFDRAIEVLGRQAEMQKTLNQSSSLPKTLLAKVILRLCKGDAAGAEQELDDAAVFDPGFYASRECEVGQQAVEGYTSSNEETLRVAVTSQTCAYLPLEVAKLARKLRTVSVNEDTNSKTAAELML